VVVGLVGLEVRAEYEIRISFGLVTFLAVFELSDCQKLRSVGAYN